MAEEQSQSVNAKAEFHEHQGRRWPVILMYLLAAFLIASAVVFGGRWVYRKVNNNTLSVKAPKVATSENKQPSDKSAQSKLSQQPAGKSTAPPAPQPSTVPNTGPGDTLAIFAFAGLAGAALYYLRLFVRRGAG